MDLLQWFRPDPGRLPRAKDVEAYLATYLAGFLGLNNQRYHSNPEPTLGTQNLATYLAENLAKWPDFRFHQLVIGTLAKLVQVYVAVEKQRPHGRQSWGFGDSSGPTSPRDTILKNENLATHYEDSTQDEIGPEDRRTYPLGDQNRHTATHAVRVSNHAGTGLRPGSR